MAKAVGPPTLVEYLDSERLVGWHGGRARCLRDRAAHAAPHSRRIRHASARMGRSRCRVPTSQAMSAGIVADGVHDTRPTARRPELHARDRKTAQIKAIQMKSFTVGRIDCDRAGAWSSMEWARSFYARRALGRHCLLVRGFVRRAVKFDDYLTTETLAGHYLTTETLAGQETSHERADG